VSRPKLLDLFCGAGGAAMGYSRAGFEVTGIDIEPMPNYPFKFVRMDALEYVAEHGKAFNVIHASPPCQGYSVMAHATGREAPRLIPATREALRATGRPYVIENVELAHREMRNYVTLCGTMFGLKIRRHRLFEMSPAYYGLLPPCACQNGVKRGQLVGQMLSGKVAPGRAPRPGIYTESDRREAIGVPWMTTMEARQAVPPAYTEFIGQQLRYLEDIRQDDSLCWACGNEAAEFCAPCGEHPSECQCPDMAPTAVASEAIR
jgi:DNA (cytosine-5)-methyltransferase 1